MTLSKKYYKLFINNKRVDPLPERHKKCPNRRFVGPDGANPAPAY